LDGISWTIQNTPNVPYSSLSGVSCASATACTVVGSYEDSTGNFVTLAEVWDGTGWTIQTTPNPAGARDSDLNGVACSSATRCTAVGDAGPTPFPAEPGAAPLAETWDGTSWTIQNTPTPGGFASSLDAVSCPTPTVCTAVGSITVGVQESPGNYSTAPQLLVERNS
jgi:hypothetical protein